MKPLALKRERGVALLALLAVIMLVASWFLVSKLNSESGGIAAVNRARNAEVLNRAKQALIGYVAMQALNSGEDNPGALPCPEAAGYFDNAGDEGKTASSCTLPKVGRFPWRTIGTEKLLDSAGEPLWYVVSPGWAVTSSGFKTNINSNTLGQLTVDGVDYAAVALIIAPGPAITVPACGAAPAKVQKRPIVDPVDGNPFPDLRNYLECENATAPTPDATFVTSGPSGSFNDQVVRVTVADIMPGIEAAIAKRIERDIVPSLKATYANTQWGSGISATRPLFPYPVPFGDPGTSNYRGSATTVGGAPQGLLPFFQTQGCDPATDPRCTTATTGGSAFLVFSKSGNDAKTAGSGSIRTQSTCSWQAEIYVCTGEYNEPSISLTFKLNVTNVAMGLRTLDLSKVTCTAVDDVGAGLPTQNVACTSTVEIQSDGSALVTVAAGPMPDIDDSGWGSYANYKINIDRAVFGDHALLSSTAPTTGWFVRNEWYRLLYYAASRELTAEKLTFTSCPITGCCTTGNNCLTVTNMVPADNKRALLILAGRSITGATRPNATLSDYLEFANADLNTTFEKQPISRASNAALKQPFNDRVIVLDSN